MLPSNPKIKFQSMRVVEINFSSFNSYILLIDGFRQRTTFELYRKKEFLNILDLIKMFSKDLLLFKHENAQEQQKCSNF